MITIPDIEDYLKKVRHFIDEGKIDFIKGRDEKYALGVLGIGLEDAFAMVYELTYKNYYRGPSPDHKFPDQEVMEFGYEDIFPELPLPKSSLYIKLVFRPQKNDLLMMSFHSATQEITYPYGEIEEISI